MSNMRVNQQPENANIPTGQSGSNNSSRPTSRNAQHSRIPPQQPQPQVQNNQTTSSSNTHVINSQYSMMDSNRFGQQQPQGIFQMDTRTKLESPNMMQKPVQTTQHQMYPTPPQQQGFGYQGWSAFQSPFAQPNNLASQFGYTSMNPPFFAQPNQQRFAQSQQIANQNQINQLFSKSQQPPQTQRQQPTTINSFPNNNYMQGSYGQQSLAQQPAAVQQLVGGINTPYREINSQMQNGLATKPIYQ